MSRGYHIKVGAAGVRSHLYTRGASIIAQQGFRRIRALHVQFFFFFFAVGVVVYFSVSRCMHEVLYDTTTVILFFVLRKHVEVVVCYSYSTCLCTTVVLIS